MNNFLSSQYISLFNNVIILDWFIFSGSLCNRSMNSSMCETSHSHPASPSTGVPNKQHSQESVCEASHSHPASPSTGVHSQESVCETHMNDSTNNLMEERKRKQSGDQADNSKRQKTQA